MSDFFYSIAQKIVGGVITVVGTLLAGIKTDKDQAAINIEIKNSKEKILYKEIDEGYPIKDEKLIFSK